MAQLRSKHPTLSGNRPLSADFTAAMPPIEASMLFSILPSAVQSRLPRLPSLRRSVSMYGLSAKKRSVHSVTSSGSRTPDSGYASAMILSRADDISSEDEMSSYFGDASSADENVSRPGTNTPVNIQIMELTEVSTGTGISWKFANQGLSLLGAAVDESSTISQDHRLGNPGFARQLYIHALTYLLQALPSDLTTEERLSVRSALPTGVIEPLRLAVTTEQISTSQTKEPPSILHRTLATTIIQFFILLQLILPYVKFFLQAAYKYEREHKISEKLLSQSIETMDGIGKRGISLTGAIYGMGDGKVGQAITETAAWFVEGVTGGIHEGVGEGMVIMGARKASGVERR
ncbi:hypothetical protein BGZ60DRAFT_424153 [Tricladium varicosporioides]|nr:hypothetical protein BGZ60DRAFT_424153 [Hymenoscyphus varicosporioides]